MVDHSPEFRAARASRINQFLGDDAVTWVFSRMERQYYEEFKNADSSEKRVTAWAKAKALSDFEKELKGILDDGELAHAEMQSLLHVDQMRRTGKPLPHE